MRDVGYNRFDWGCGNLIPIRREDYVDLNPVTGAEQRGRIGWLPDFENGGASACYAYYTIEALRMLGREKEATRSSIPS